MDAGPSRRPEATSSSSSTSWLPWSSSSSRSSPPPSAATLPDSPTHASSSPTTSSSATTAATGPDGLTDTLPASTDDPKPVTKRYDISIPSSLAVLTPAAAAVGLFIGMRRGGDKARLRFLAENAHRQPTTVQGWYFYTKTRNYRMLFGALREGGRTALKLGTAGALFAVGEEGVGWLRERLLDSSSPHDDTRTPPNPNRVGWRKGPVYWEDGALSGSVLALMVGLIYRLPNPTMLRVLIMGFGLGGTTSALRIAQDKIAHKKAEEEKLAALNAPEGGEQGDEKKPDWGWGWVWRMWK